MKEPHVIRKASILKCSHPDKDGEFWLSDPPGTEPMTRTKIPEKI